MSASVMRRVSIRNLKAHKLRLFLTIFSIVLGTCFVAGSIVFTSTVSKAFSDIFDHTAPGVAVQISPENRQSPGVPKQVVDDLTARRGELGIDRLVTDYSGTVTIAQADGKALQTGGAPSLGSAFIPADQALSPETSKLLPGGRAPVGPGEIALNSSAAEKAGLSVGSTTKVVLGQGAAQPREVKVVGLLDLPGSTSGFVNVQFDPTVARELFSDGTHSAQVEMSAAAGVTPEQLQERVRAALPDANDYQVRTGAEVRQDQKDSVNQFLTIFTGILLAFAAIGLIVGTFIIYNTFSMIVAQRNRELALLRAVGASRRQISRSVLFEALIVGVIGGVIGLGIGIGIAALLKAITGSQSGLPEAPLQIGLPAILASLFVGVVVTMISAWVPAIRASRVPPVEAMRAGMAEGSASLVPRTVAGAILGVAGLAAIILGAFGEGLGPALTVGAGAAATIVAVVLAGPALSRPIVGALGRVIGAPFGKIGALARTNAVRNPRRTAATAFALTLGLMLVAVIGTLGTSFKSTVDDAVDSGLRADYLVTGANQMPIPGAVADSVAKVDGVSKAISFGMIAAKVNGKDDFGTAALGGQPADVAVINAVAGSDQLPDDGLLISERTSRDRGWHVGDSVTFASPTGDEVRATVAGIFADNETLQPWIAGPAIYDRLIPAPMRVSAMVLVLPSPNISSAQLRTNLEDATSSFLTVQVQDRQEFKGSVSEQIDSMLVTLYAMLGLALVIAVLGIINTLALSVVERTREIGMLRAVGMLRSQVRRSIYLESVLIAIFGAVTGVVLGCVIGWALVCTLAKWGLGDPVLPWTLIVITLIGSAIVGVLAALWPAVRAARTRPLEAIVEA